MDEGDLATLEGGPLRRLALEQGVDLSDRPSDEVIRLRVKRTALT